MKHFRYGLLLAMLLIQSCSSTVVATPTLEKPSPVLPTPTVEQPSNISPTLTAEVQEPTPTPTYEPPAGYKEYHDSVVGISIYIPESWMVTGVVAGQYAILQSYPEDKYIGGEMLEPG
ncbi:MAG: hypothetical protein KAI94_02715, partial [Anaerolineales bacterium]|nr:hypothetical protein [Anaerolineales bacterium]